MDRGVRGLLGGWYRDFENVPVPAQQGNVRPVLERMLEATCQPRDGRPRTEGNPKLRDERSAGAAVTLAQFGQFPIHHPGPPPQPPPAAPTPAMAATALPVQQATSAPPPILTLAPPPPVFMPQPGGPPAAHVTNLPPPGPSEAAPSDAGLDTSQYRVYDLSTKPILEMKVNSRRLLSNSCPVIYIPGPDDEDQ